MRRLAQLLQLSGMTSGGDFGHPARPLYRVIVPATEEPMDFSAWFEAYLGGKWHTFDARNNIFRMGRSLMACGGAAADVALLTSFGPSRLLHFTALTEEGL